MEAHMLYVAGLLGVAAALLLSSIFPFGLLSGRDLSCLGSTGPVQWWLVYPDVNHQTWMYVDNTSPTPVRMDSIPRQSDPAIRTLGSVTRDVSRLVYPGDSRRNDKPNPQGFLAYTSHSGVWVSYTGSLTGHIGADKEHSIMTCVTVKGQDSVSRAVSVVMAHNPRSVQPEAASPKDSLPEGILPDQQFHLRGAFEANWGCLHAPQSSYYTICFRTLSLSGVSASVRIASASARIGIPWDKFDSASAKVHKPVCLEIETPTQKEGYFQVTLQDCADGALQTVPSKPLFSVVGNPVVDRSHVVCANTLFLTEGAADLICVSHPELWLSLKQRGSTSTIKGTTEQAGSTSSVGAKVEQTGNTSRVGSSRAQQRPGNAEIIKQPAKILPVTTREDKRTSREPRKVTTYQDCALSQVSQEAPEQECADLCSHMSSNCRQFFPGSPWPASSYTTRGARHSCPVCQTRAGEDSPLYAAVYNTHYRIPEYTASAIVRDPEKPTFERPDSNYWNRVELGLCPEKLHLAIEEGCDVNTATWGITGRDDLCPLPSWVTDMLWREEDCGRCQSLSGDYSSCGYYFNRGHLNPNSVNNQTEDVQLATFSFLNAAPQAADFNQCTWQPYECAVGLIAEQVFRRAAGAGSDSRSLYVITGTKLGRGHSWLKGRAAIPDFYWKAVCYPGDEDKNIPPFAFGFYATNRNCTTVKTLELGAFQEWLYRGSFYPESQLFPGSACVRNVSMWTDESGESFDTFVEKVTPECQKGTGDLEGRCADPNRPACQKPRKPVAPVVTPPEMPTTSPEVDDKTASLPPEVPPVSPEAEEIPKQLSQKECILYKETHKTPQERCAERCSYLQWQDCSEFFVGTAWPPSSYRPSAASCPICQTQADNETVLFATMFNTEFRIPEYTADAIVRAPHGLEDPRDDDSTLWNRVQLGLCSTAFHDHIRDTCEFPETWWWGVTKVSSRRCRLKSHLYLDECGDCQALDDDFDGCGKFADRGHLNPNAINNRDEASREATFSFINVAPQAPSFNRHVWEGFEEKVRYKAEEVYREAKAAGSGKRTIYIITGTKTGPGNEWLKGRVAFPDYFWKAVCYPGDEFAGLSPFGVGFYGRNVDFIEVSDMVALTLQEFDLWLYDGGDDHIFQGSVCATDVDKWDIEYD